MLESLSNRTQSEALDVLSQVSSHLLPDPELEPRDSKDDLYVRVMSEVHKKLNLSPEDKTPEARYKILNLLSNEMSRVAFSEVDEKVVKARVGQRGDLRPGLYEVIIPQSARDELAKWGIRPNHVRSAIDNPTYFEHLLPENHGLSKDSAISLFAKEIVTGQNKIDNHFLLVLTIRRGYEQIVHWAFRIYPSDVDLSEIRSPLDMLKAFTNKYGLNIQIGTQTGKFIHLAIVENSKIALQTELLRVLEATVSEGGLYWMTRETNVGTTEIAIAFAIDISMYELDLKKHRVSL
jgi:hypothetical protein